MKPALEAPASTGASRMVLAALVAIVVTCGLLLLQTFHGDPTIYLPYARNVARGDFFAFNPGEFSTGSTSPLWALILGLGFLLPQGVLAAKLIALAFAVAAVVACWMAIRKLTGHPMGASLATALVAANLTMPALLLYESALIVLLVSLLLLETAEWLTDDPPRGARILRLAALWAFIPLARPDALALVLLHAAALAIELRRRNRRGALPRVAVALGLAALPAAAYYGASMALLGSPSVSSYCRAFGIAEYAPRLFGRPYSLSTIRFLLGSTMLVWALAAVWGWTSLRRTANGVWIAFFSLAAVAAYAFAFTWVSPIAPSPMSTGSERYILPVFPLIALLAAPALGQAWEAAPGTGGGVLIRTAMVLLLVGHPMAQLIEGALGEAPRRLTFDVITEKRMVDALNDRADSGAVVLSYEVQNRFHMRRDLRLLSLDGLTDGKVGPYLASRDLGGFLRRHRPDYWLANDAVRERPFLAHSVLATVLDSLEAGHSTVRADGMRFDVLIPAPEPPPRGFAASRYVVEITYPDERGESADRVRDRAGGGDRVRH